MNPPSSFTIWRLLTLLMLRLWDRWFIRSDGVPCAADESCTIEHWFAIELSWILWALWIGFSSTGWRLLPSSFDAASYCNLFESSLLLRSWETWPLFTLGLPTCGSAWFPRSSDMRRPRLFLCGTFLSSGMADSWVLETIFRPVPFPASCAKGLPDMVRDFYIGRSYPYPAVAFIAPTLSLTKEPVRDEFIPLAEFKTSVNFVFILEKKPAPLLFYESSDSFCIWTDWLPWLADVELKLAPTALFVSVGGANAEIRSYRNLRFV